MNMRMFRVLAAKMCLSCDIWFLAPPLDWHRIGVDEDGVWWGRPRRYDCVLPAFLQRRLLFLAAIAVAISRRYHVPLRWLVTGRVSRQQVRRDAQATDGSGPCVVEMWMVRISRRGEQSAFSVHRISVLAQSKDHRLGYLVLDETGVHRPMLSRHLGSLICRQLQGVRGGVRGQN
jgi:hypothetical protein